jgi:hypothetical protein
MVPEDVLVRITVANRGPEAATIHVLPTLWFRNQWSWTPGMPKPTVRQTNGRKGIRAVAASHAELGDRWLYADGDVPPLFTENETNTQRLFGTANAGAHVKDGINDYIVLGRKDAVNPAGTGTKVAAHHRLNVEAGGTAELRLRLTDSASGRAKDPFAGFNETFEERRNEADEEKAHVQVGALRGEHRILDDRLLVRPVVERVHVQEQRYGQQGHHREQTGQELRCGRVHAAFALHGFYDDAAHLVVHHLARGRQVRVVRHVLPQAGKDLVLTLDRKIQELAEKELRQSATPARPS